MTKVLLCSPKGNTGGIARWTSHLLDYYDNLKDKNISLTWFYVDRCEKDMISSVGIMSRIYWGVKKYIPFLFRLNKHLSKNQYDVVHFTSSASIGLVRDLGIIRICHKQNIKVIVHFRFGRIPQIYKKVNFEKRLIHKVINKSDKVIVIDEFSYNTLKKEEYKNIELVPNPVTPIINDILKNNDIKRDIREILFVGHVVLNKGIFELVKACSQISNIKLKILGICPNDMYNKLYELGGENSQCWLFIKGDQPFECVIKEMMQCGVFVLPTYTEGFPNVIIESMACGCPIVTTPVGAIPEMLDIKYGEYCGICVPTKNVEKLKEAIERMLNDRKYALQCGRNAQDRVNRYYSMPIVWNHLVEIWKNI